MRKQYLIILLLFIFFIAAGIIFFLIQGTKNAERQLPYQDSSPGENSEIQTIEEEYTSREKCQFSLYRASRPEDSFFPLYDPTVKKEIDCHFIIHPDLPEYTFHIVGKTGQNEYERIEVTRKDDSSYIQTFSGDDIQDTSNSSGREFQTQDINFDGYLDIKTAIDYGTIGCVRFNYWVFKPKTSTFELMRYLGGCNPMPNPENKEIMVDEYFGGLNKSIHQWIDEKLILVRVVLGSQELPVPEQCRNKTKTELVDCVQNQ